MKILITGGAGYIGSHTAVELLNAGHIPVILDNFSNSQNWIIDRIKQITNKSITVYNGDCTDSNFVKKVFADENDIEGVIHFAAFKAVGESIEKPLPYYHNNINSLLTLLKIMQQFHVKNIVFSSSATVYGEPDKNPLTEQSPRKEATNPYGRTKIIAEDILNDVVKSGSKINAIALRYFNPIGAHESHLIGELPLGTPNNLVPYLTQTAAGLRDKLTIFGDDYNTPDGTCVRDFIHVSDLASAHIATMNYLDNQDAPFFDVFNVGTGQGTSVMELINTFQEINNIKLNHIIGSRRPGDVEACWADPTKINSTMNWQAQKTLSDALKDAWQWQKSL